MKKIVGILAGAAVLASSVFAADISAGARLEGDLFNYDGAADTAKAIMIKGANNPWDVPATFSVSSDNAGATWKFTDNGDGHTLKTSNYQIWFKPLDMLTVKVGNIAESMNTEKIAWTGRVLNYDSFGYEAVYAQDALTIALAFVPGEGNYWFEAKDSASKKEARLENAAIAALKAWQTAKDAKAQADAKAAYDKAQKEYTDYKAKTSKEKDDEFKNVDDKVKELNLFAQYSADFGTIKAMYDANDAFKVNTIAVGYNNTFDALEIFADVAMKLTSTRGKYFNDKGEDEKLMDIGLIVDAYAQYNMDALTLQAYVKGTIGQLNNFDKKYGTVNYKGDVYNAFTMPNNFALMTKVKVAYKLDPVTVFAQLVSDNILEKEIKASFFKDPKNEDPYTNVFVSEIKAGVQGSVGICSWECAAQINTGKGVNYDKINFSVPVNFKVNF